MAPIGIRREEKKGFDTRKGEVLRKRPSLQGGRNRRLVESCLSKLKLMRFYRMPFLGQRKGTKGKKEQVGLGWKVKEPKGGSATTCFWRDPEAAFCVICGEDKENHLELMCPYNYLSPDAFVPCRARLALWGDYTTTLRFKCSRHKEEEQREPPRHDEANSRRLGFLRCFVRVNNLPERCRPEELAGVFSRFGPLRMWLVAMQKPGTCKGFGGIVFQRPEHANEAIQALNSCDFGGRKLRVDGAYPCLHC